MDDAVFHCDRLNAALPKLRKRFGKVKAQEAFASNSHFENLSWRL